jgi:hypothetical protein
LLFAHSTFHGGFIFPRYIRNPGWVLSQRLKLCFIRHIVIHVFVLAYPVPRSIWHIIVLMNYIRSKHQT